MFSIPNLVVGLVLADTIVVAVVATVVAQIIILPT
jgi:hypothetical protein